MNSNQISASELVRIVTETTSRTIAETLPNALVETFVRLGLVSVTLNPGSVPTNAPEVSSAKVQTPTVPTVQVPSVKAPRVGTLPTATATATATPTNKTNGASKAQAAREIPPYGDFHAKVTTGDNGRTKLPMGLFEGFKTIVLNLPNGQDLAVDVDVEGRAKLTRAQVESINARPGHYLVFTSIQPGVFDVSIYGKADSEQAAHVSQGPRVGLRQAVNMPTVQAQTDDVGAAFAVAVNSSTGEVKKQRTAKQLANDARLREAAKARKGTGASKGDNGKVKPNMVAVPPTAKQARVEATREANHAQAASKQKDFYAGIVQAVRFNVPAR